MFFFRRYFSSSRTKRITRYISIFLQYSHVRLTCNSSLNSLFGLVISIKLQLQAVLKQLKSCFDVRNNRCALICKPIFDLVTASEMSEAQRRIHIGLSADDRRFHLNIVKMLSCLLAEYIVRFDNDQTNKSSDFDMPAPKVKSNMSCVIFAQIEIYLNRKEKKEKMLMQAENRISLRMH